MKTQKKDNLVFTKNSISELNDRQLQTVFGGSFSDSFSGPLCDWIIDILTNPK